MYEVRVERDSITPDGVRATSFVIQFPRRVLAEFVTHRVNSDTWGEFECIYTERTTNQDISKNSASSRAIPFKRMLEKVQTDTFYPRWTMNEKGMQGSYTTNQDVIRAANSYWDDALESCACYAEKLHELGIHKQDCNRLLEPWAWVTQIVTSSRWDNFFALRCHKAADPHFRKVARMMFLARRKSTPVALNYGQWHLPFVPMDQQMQLNWHPLKSSALMPYLIKYSAARCGWVSYENHDKDGTPEAMLRTFDRFLADEVKHASPVEHQLSPMSKVEESNLPHLRSNIQGWIQARKLIPHEVVTNYDPSPEELATWIEDVDLI